MRKFTTKELEGFDGRSGVSYIAYGGKVYDASHSFHWRNGRHHFRHCPGCDLTQAMKQAPHGVDLLDRLPLIGELVD